MMTTSLDVSFGRKELNNYAHNLHILLIDFLEEKLDDFTCYTARVALVDFALKIRIFRMYKNF